MTAAFLAQLDPSRLTHAFTTRTRGRKDLSRVLIGTYAALEAKLRVFNEDLDADVWFTVNRTDGLGRKAENITHFTAFYADCDNGAPEHWPGGLPPSVVVQTSPGKVQAYWVLTEPIANTSATLDEWERIEAAFVTACGADTAAKDVARVLRVPGFKNRKYKGLPVATVLEQHDFTYTIAEILKYLTVAPPVAQTVQNAPSVQDETPDEYSRTLRYQKWLKAIPVGEVPAPGGGKRNGWYYAKAAYGVRDLGLSVDVVAGELAMISETWHAGASYDYDKCAEIAGNAARHGRHAKGRLSQVANLVVSMDDEPLQATGGDPTVVPITKNLKTAPGGDDAARKIRATALRAKTELAEIYQVLTDDRGETSYARILGPGIITPCVPAVITQDMMRRYGADLTPSKIKHEVLPMWTATAEKVLSNSVRPFVFFNDASSGLAWQRLPFSPDPTATCPETLKEVLSRTSEAEAKSLVLWVGSLLDYTFPRSQYLYLWGEGNDGKSSLIKAIISVFAPQGVASMRSEDLRNHGTSRLEGTRLVCFTDENNSSFMSSGIFKAITGDDTMTINPKKEALRNIRIFAKVLIASNSAPTLAGGNADYRRILPVKLASYKAGSDQAFVDRMFAEAQTIMQYCYLQFANWKAEFPNKQLPVSEDRMEDVKLESDESEGEDLANNRLDFSDPTARIAAANIASLFSGRPDARLPKNVAAYLRSRGLKSIPVKEGGVVRKYWVGIKPREGTRVTVSH